jgi:hypothetical protein
MEVGAAAEQQRTQPVADRPAPEPWATGLHGKRLEADQEVA